MPRRRLVLHRSGHRHLCRERGRLHRAGHELDRSGRPGSGRQGAITPATSAGAVSFYTAGQDADGGWSFYPSSPGNPQSTDPNSTALVIQALIALGQSPTGPTFAHGVANPVSALLAFQLTSGANAGAFQTAFAPGSPDILASYQATPAVAGVSFAIPLGASNGSYWLVGSNGGVTPGNAIFHGSLPALGLTVSDVVGMAGAPDGGGYWDVAADGGVFAFGTAPFHGSMGGKRSTAHRGHGATADGGGLLAGRRRRRGLRLRGRQFRRVAGRRASSTRHRRHRRHPRRQGYWLVGGRRRGLRLRGRRLRGSLPGSASRSVTSWASPPADRGGYWLAGCRRRGLRLRAPRPSTDRWVVSRQPTGSGLAVTPDGGGYWEVARDGGVFAFGDAHSSEAVSASGVVGIATNLGRAT